MKGGRKEGMERRKLKCGHWWTRKNSARCGLCDKCEKCCTCHEDGTAELASGVVKATVEAAVIGGEEEVCEVFWNDALGYCFQCGYRSDEKGTFCAGCGGKAVLVDPPSDRCSCGHSPIAHNARGCLICSCREPRK